MYTSPVLTSLENYTIHPDLILLALFYGIFPPHLTSTTQALKLFLHDSRLIGTLMLRFNTYTHMNIHTQVIFSTTNTEFLIQTNAF